MKLSTIPLLILCLSAIATFNIDAQTLPLSVKNADVIIKGQIVLPDQQPAKAILIMVGGSGVKLRSDTAPMNAFFLKMGYAVVNYDRRGNGESTGQYNRPSSKNSAMQIPLFAADVSSIASSLKKDKRLPSNTIIAMGSSMGAWIAPLAASANKDIDLVISLVGAAMSVGQSDHFDYLTDMGLSIEQATGLMHTLKNDTSYDPYQALSQMTQPALWIYGELDDSNPTAIDVMQLLTIQTEHNKQFEIKVIKDANHEMVNQQTKKMDMSWAKHLSGWINSHL